MKTHYTVEHYLGNGELFASTRLETKEEAIDLATLWHLQWPKETYRVVEVIETSTTILEFGDSSTTFPLC